MNQMKTIIKKAGILYMALSFGLTSCETFDFGQEMGQKVICIISDDDLVFTGMHDLNEPESTGYISVNCGGSLHIDRDVEVWMEYSPEVLAQYNKSKYDIDEEKYAKELDSRYYTIPEMRVTLKASSADTYDTIPIRVRPEGLSPDSIYFIPLRIRSVSAYSVNPDKSQVLYRVYMKNLYARSDEASIYNATGTTQKDGENEVEAAASQTFHPLTKNTFRIFAGIKGYETDADVIRKNGIIVQVNEDHSLTMRPYDEDSIEVAPVDASRPDYYGEYSLSEVYGGKKRQRFDFKYKYRFKGDTQWETVNLRSLRSVTLDLIDE